MSIAVEDVFNLLNGIPPGAWVAISESKHLVLSYGADLQAVDSEARSKGEQTPLIVRVPEHASLMYL